MGRKKPKEPAVCPECSVTFRDGRWKWPDLPVPEDAHRHLCPACQRRRDDYPAGWLTLSGSFVRAHKDEIVRLARHQEELERGEHPLHRIMDVRDDGDDLVVTTTDIHLPRRIGEAIHHAYQGALDFHYADEDYFLRVFWKRDD